MVIQLSLQKNSPIDKLVVVILCAGEGNRIREYAKDIPKPLLKIEQLENKTILHDTIFKLFTLGITKIAIIKGYLGDKIEEHVNSLLKKNNNLINVITVIDSGMQYKSGPLHSFLSITKNDTLFNEKSIYFVLPGDTIFQFNLLNHVLNFIIENIQIIEKTPLVFYKMLNAMVLKDKYNEKTHDLASIAEIEKRGYIDYLKKIDIKKVHLFSNSDDLNLIVPVFALSGSIIKELIKLRDERTLNTMREGINLLIEGGEAVRAMKIPNNYEYHDIDEKSDIEQLNIEKK